MELSPATAAGTAYAIRYRRRRCCRCCADPAASGHDVPRLGFTKQALDFDEIEFPADIPLLSDPYPTFQTPPTLTVRRRRQE
jgi:hypothetical protein